MDTFGSATMGFMGFFFCREAAERDYAAVTSDLRFPRFFLEPSAKGNALQPVFVQRFSVDAILKRSGFTKIGKAIVRTIPVDVVNLILWPLSLCVKPSEPMLSVGFSVDLDRPVSLPVEVPGALSDTDSRARGCPSENAGLSVVCKNSGELFMCYHGKSILPYTK